MQSKNKKSTGAFKERLKASQQDQDSSIFGSSFKMDDVKGDTNIRYIPVDQLKSAPAKWNFYKPLDEAKMNELVQSIKVNGLLQPIVVWEQDDSQYMILAGHNRAKAYEYLKEITEEDDYDKIPALIKKKDQIDEIEAREIIIDTNWVQRTLSAIEKSKSIVQKYTVLKRKAKNTYADHGSGRIRDEIAAEYEISGRLVDDYRRLNNLNGAFKALLEKNKISFTAAAKVSSLDDELQNFILKNYSDKLHRKYIKNINSKSTKDDLIRIFEVDDNKKILALKVGSEVIEKYKNLSKNEQVIINTKIEKLIREYQANNTGN